MSFSLIWLLTDLAQSPLARRQRRKFERILSVLRVACQNDWRVAPAQSDQEWISQRVRIEPAFRRRAIHALARILFGKTASTFPGHALAPAADAAGSQICWGAQKNKNPAARAIRPGFEKSQSERTRRLGGLVSLESALFLDRRIGRILDVAAVIECRNHGGDANLAEATVKIAVTVARFPVFSF
jgi:hypothetical protein